MLDIKFGKDYARALLQAVGWVCRSCYGHQERHCEQSQQNEFVWKNIRQGAAFYVKYRFFGEMGIVQMYNKQIKAKLDNQGIPCMFVGYSKEHKADVYHMLNKELLRSSILKT